MRKNFRILKLYKNGDHIHRCKSCGHIWRHNRYDCVNTHECAICGKDEREPSIEMIDGQVWWWPVGAKWDHEKQLWDGTQPLW